MCQEFEAVHIICAIALFLFGSAAFLRAQSTNASLAGRVTDPSKAVVVNASIDAVSEDTNVRYSTLSNLSGEYRLPNVPPGVYRIEIEKTGFKKLIKPNVVLHVQDAPAIDFEMTLGALSEIITVEAGAPLVNTESAAVSTVVDRTFGENLPLNGRSLQTLITLTPGVVLTAAAFDDQGQFSVNGQRADANYFTVDGVSANFGVTGYFPMVQTAGGGLPALSASGGTNSLVSADAMQEFRIQTSSFAPEFGRTPGGQISIATRSGTNSFHGSVSEYFRNSVLDASDWFVNFNRLTKPAERSNDFGGVFGGPVIKDKTFFFYSYEGLRVRQPSTLQTAVPDAVSRQQAPAGMRPFLNAFPIANGSGLGSGLAQFNAGYSNPSSLDASSIRVDHKIGAKLNLFARYNYSPSNSGFRAPPLSRALLLSLTNSIESSMQTGTLGLTHSIAPGVSNELRANYSNHRVSSAYIQDSFGGAVPPPDSVLFPAGRTSSDSVFGLNIAGAGQVSPGKGADDEQRQINLVDNISVAKGRHEWKFGVDYRWLAPFSSPYTYRQYVQFTGMTDAPGGALSGMASLAATYSDRSNALLSQNFSMFGQDTWKVTRRFTITYGLRWDVNPPLKGKNSANDPFTVTGLNDLATLGLAPRGTPLYQTTYGNVAPRLGLAWQLGGRPNWGLTLRAGFGVFYDLGQGSLGGVSSYFPYLTVKAIGPAPVPFPLSSQDATPPPASISPPVSTMLVADPHLKLPRSYQWNIALEQAMGNSQSLSLTYIGALGRDLLRATNLYNVNPNFPFISVTDNSTTSDYHAVQVKFQRRFSRGLQAIGSYTFSHSIDSASTDAFANYLNTAGSIAGPNVDRGNSDFDIRQAFTSGVTYDLPAAGSGKAVHAVSSGWSLDSFVLARSAPPADVVAGIFFAGGTALYPRPDLNRGVPLELTGAGYPGNRIFNPAAFAGPPPGRQGSLGRNVLRGFRAAQVDLGVQRQFQLGERMRVRFRAEFFNILNHPNFGNPNTDLTSPLFGRSIQTLANSLGSGGANGGFNPLYQVGGPRSIQLALKLQF